MFGETWQKIWEKIKKSYQDWENQAPEKMASFQPPVNTQALVKNTIDQTPYTPEAQQYLQNVPVNSSPNLPPNVGGNYNGEVNVNQNTAPGNMPKILRHEYLHSMDANVNSPYDASMPQYPLDSYGFSEKLSEANPRNNARLNEMLSGAGIYGNQSGEGTPMMMDVEKLAYFMQNPGVMNNTSPEIMELLKRIYQPMSKNINYSPMYPVNNMMEAYFPQ